MRPSLRLRLSSAVGVRRPWPIARCLPRETAALLAQALLVLAMVLPLAPPRRPARRRRRCRKPATTLTCPLWTVTRL
jgi:hypothetical protein